jgi:hypothetical protein
MTFNDYVKKFQAYKLKESGKSKVSKEELGLLREKFSARVKEQQGHKRLQEALSNFRQYKVSKGLSNTIEFDEYKRLKEAILKPSQRHLTEKSFDTLVENYRKFKESQGGGTKVTYSEVKNLRESWNKNRGRLREADAGFDPTAGMAGPDPAMGGALPPAGPATPVDPTLAAQIQDVKASVDALATAAGIQTTDLGADPNAGQPPVDGMGADGMGAAVPQQPMMESLIAKFAKYTKLKENRDPTTKEVEELRESIISEQIIKFTKYAQLKENRDPTAAEIKSLRESILAPTPKVQKSKLDIIRERIAAREEKLNENAAQELGKKVLSNLGGPQARASFEPDKTGGTKSDGGSNEELVQVPGAKTLANGYASGPAEKPAKTWPTKAISGKGVTAPLQGAGASQQGGTTSPKVKESLRQRFLREEEEEKKKDEPTHEFKKKMGSGELWIRKDGKREYTEDEIDENGNRYNESVKSVTDAYVDDYLNTPKLNFNRIREAISTGMLG